MRLPPLWCVAVVCLAGCQTVRTSIPVSGSRAALVEATLQSAKSLGWEAHLADSGQILLISTGTGHFSVSPEDNALRFDTERALTDQTFLLAAMAENQLTGRRGETLTTRSAPLAVALGAVLPFTSRLYLGASDPVGASMGLHFGTMLALHLVMDLLAVEMALLALQRSSVPGPIDNWAFVGYAVSAALLNRVLAVVHGVQISEQRNAWAEAGVEIPTTAQLDSARPPLW